MHFEKFVCKLFVLRTDRLPHLKRMHAVGLPMRNTNIITKFANSETLAMIPNNFAAILNNV